MKITEAIERVSVSHTAYIRAARGMKLYESLPLRTFSPRRSFHKAPSGAPAPPLPFRDPRLIVVFFFFVCLRIEIPLHTIVGQEVDLSRGLLVPPWVGRQPRGTCRFFESEVPLEQTQFLGGDEAPSCVFPRFSVRVCLLEVICVTTLLTIRSMCFDFQATLISRRSLSLFA